MRKDEKNKNETTQEEVKLVLPQKGELFAIVTSELGGARFNCLCSDKKERVCRVPGRLKRDLWIKEGDYVIVKPWDVESDKKGDIVYRYRPLEVELLKKKGFLKELEE